MKIFQLVLEYTKAQYPAHEFRTSCLWELLYAADLVIVAESQEELKRKLAMWKKEIELRGLRINMKKTKNMQSRYSVSMQLKMFI